jgi:hypothetical protein
MTWVAHAGHLLVDVPLFGGPLFLVVAALMLHAAHVRRTEGPDSEED